MALLALAALDDVTTGVEPKSLEWLMAAFAAVWFLAAGVRTRKRRRIRCASTTTGSGS